MGQYYNPNLVTDKLVYHLDHANLRSDNRLGQGTNIIRNLVDNRTFTSSVVSSSFAWNSGNLGFRSFSIANINIAVPFAIDSNKEFSISFWAKNSGGLDNSKNCLGSNENSDRGAIIHFPNRVGTGRTIEFIVSNSTNSNLLRYDDINTQYMSKFGLWTFTKNASIGASRMRIYYNTEIIASNTGASYQATATASWTIGSDTNGQKYAGVDLAAYFIHQKELSSDEIQKLYHAYKGRYGL